MAWLYNGFIRLVENRRRPGFAVLLAACVVQALACLAQAPPDPNQPDEYRLRLTANEISLLFHAFDASGNPLLNITRDELVVKDNGKIQTAIVSLESFHDLPIRAGFLFDTSESMTKNLDANRAAISMYATRLLRKGSDQAFVIEFETETHITQPWTDDPARIASGAASVHMRKSLTAVYDSLFKTCRDLWTSDRSSATGNFILLFSDGQDNNSQRHLNETVDMCQRTRTAIYAITNSRRSGSNWGQRILERLASETGGRVFFNPTGATVWADLQAIEAEQRNQYRLDYKPVAFVPDRKFHTIKITCRRRGAKILSRTGYYAFAQTD